MNYPEWFKNWVVKLSFVDDRLSTSWKQAEEYWRIDGFKKALKDLEETNQYNTEERAKELMEERLTKLLSIADLSQVITFNSKTGTVYIGGEVADAGRLSNLHAEAEFLFESELWKIMVETPKRLAEKAMFIDEGNLDNQLLKGRVILFTLDTQLKIAQTFKNYQTKQSTPQNPSPS